MNTGDSVVRGREAIEQRAWGDAYAQLSAADQDGALEPADLEQLATSAYLTGREAAALDAWERAHHAHLEAGDAARAVRCAFWLGLALVQRGEHAQGGGWLARAQRMFQDSATDGVERGYLLIPAALQALGGGDGETAFATFEEVAEIAGRFGDADLVTLGRLGRGQALVALGAAAEGVVLLDEAMVEVTSGAVSPVTAGIVYCAVIIACQEIFDLRRAQEWTAALSRWCASQQDLQPYRGQCLVHRSEIMQLRGEWADAMAEAQQACEHLSASAADPVLGMAQYQQAELLRLRGEFARAEETYRKASRWGHPAHPGLALLRLAQGRVADADAAIRRAAGEADGEVERARVLAAYVEIVLAAGDADAAREATDELDELASGFDSPYLKAVVAYARGAVALAAGDASSACAVLRRAWRSWQELDAPYEAARVRLLMARACQTLGDDDTAEMELDAARRVFQDLGAAPALAMVQEASRRTGRRAPGGLTPREMEVLRLVADGATNREIANTLVISDKTVARHLSNTFTKLGISSRAAATAYAYEHDLV
jgi:DNA-binding NarL/FixJ family response regulator